jgi:signal transduction histidine kinase
MDVVAGQVQAQLVRISAGFDRPDRFPYLDPFIESGLLSGFCVKFADLDGRLTQSSCSGSGNEAVPALFATAYRATFGPGQETVRLISWRGKPYGRISVAANAEGQIARAWHDVGVLLGLTTITVLSVCMLVYFAMARALRPTRTILLGFERLERGDLSVRLPEFEPIELQKISAGFNRLAAGLELSIAERAELTRKLVNVQEEERRYLARELHDEFGQSLAAINAVAASVTQTAEQERSSLVSEGEKLSRIAGHMMVALRSMLNRLRPPGIDELGLVESIEGLVAEYGSRGTQVQLDANGNFGRLSETITVSVFRIVQECLTNVSKHAGATRAKVKLEWSEPAQSEPGQCSIDVTVEDDGRAEDLSFVRNPGMGLLGIRERVAALGGQLTLRTRESRGLVVHARIPVVAAS